MAHERIVSDRPRREISDRAFGLTMAFLFLSLATWQIFSLNSALLAAAGFGLGSILLGCAFFSPSMLHGFKIQWLRFGDFLGRWISPLILGFFFISIFLLYSLALRAIGTFAKFRFKDDSLDTYWVPREKVKADERSFQFQF